MVRSPRALDQPRANCDRLLPGLGTAARTRLAPRIARNRGRGRGSQSLVAHRLGSLLVAEATLGERPHSASRMAGRTRRAGGLLRPRRLLAARWRTGGGRGNWNRRDVAIRLSLRRGADAGDECDGGGRGAPTRRLAARSGGRARTARTARGWLPRTSRSLRYLEGARTRPLRERERNPRRRDPRAHRLVRWPRSPNCPRRLTPNRAARHRLHERTTRTDYRTEGTNDARSPNPLGRNDGPPPRLELDRAASHAHGSSLSRRARPRRGHGVFVLRNAQWPLERAFARRLFRCRTREVFVVVQRGLGRVPQSGRDRSVEQVADGQADRAFEGRRPAGRDLRAGSAAFVRAEGIGKVGIDRLEPHHPHRRGARCEWRGVSEPAPSRDGPPRLSELHCD